GLGAAGSDLPHLRRHAGANAYRSRNPAGCAYGTDRCASLRAASAPSLQGGEPRMIGLENASVAFGPRTIFKDISFNVPIGRSMAILGPNGRGKTTLLRATLGFQTLASGKRFAPRVAGYVPQHGASQAKL